MLKKFNVLLIIKRMVTVLISLWLLIIARLFKLIPMLIVILKPYLQAIKMLWLLMDNILGPKVNVLPEISSKKVMLLETQDLDVMNSNVLMDKFNL